MFEVLNSVSGKLACNSVGISHTYRLALPMDIKDKMDGLISG